MDLAELTGTAKGHNFQVGSPPSRHYQTWGEQQKVGKYIARWGSKDPKKCSAADSAKIANCKQLLEEWQNANPEGKRHIVEQFNKGLTGKAKVKPSPPQFVSNDQSYKGDSESAIRKWMFPGEILSLNGINPMEFWAECIHKCASMAESLFFSMLSHAGAPLFFY